MSIQRYILAFFFLLNAFANGNEFSRSEELPYIPW